MEDERRAEALRSVISQQDVGETMPSFDRVLFGPDGQLWVRTIGAESANLHPYLRPDMPGIEPQYRTWDVFDMTGSLVGAVELPSKFSPQTATSGRIFGFLELAKSAQLTRALEHVLSLPFAPPSALLMVHSALPESWEILAVENGWLDPHSLDRRELLPSGS